MNCEYFRARRRPLDGGIGLVLLLPLPAPLLLLSVNAARKSPRSNALSRLFLRAWARMVCGDRGPFLFRRPTCLRGGFLDFFRGFMGMIVRGEKGR